MNPLEDWFEHTQGRQVHKWMHYFDIYHRHLKRFRGRAVRFVEFGVSLGGSAQMWREYFSQGVLQNAKMAAARSRTSQSMSASSRYAARWKTVPEGVRLGDGA